MKYPFNTYSSNKNKRETGNIECWKDYGFTRSLDIIGRSVTCNQYGDQFGITF